MLILSWNLLKRAGAGTDDIRRLVETHHPDLVLLQEATKGIDRLPELLGGHYVREVMPGGHDGPAAWSKSPFTTETISLPIAGRLDIPVPVFRSVAPRVALVVRFREMDIANVHLDHGQRANRRQLRHLLECCPGIEMVIGDYNALGPTSLEGFSDVGPRCPTHVAYGVIPVRLDRCLLRGGRVTKSTALARGLSDHRPILIEFAV